MSLLNLDKKFRLSSVTNVIKSLLDFENFVLMLIEVDKKINIISKKTSIENEIRERHIIDSAQVIDLIDINSDILTDIGSGGGMPGIIISIMTKNIKNSGRVIIPSILK